MLLLGGDAHYGREVILLDLFKAGLLDRALWSLSKPQACERSPVPAAWAAFCTHLPKTLDRKLEGPLDGSDKDVTFPPSVLYDTTRFSFVFESVVTVETDFPVFLTEKVIKPIVPRSNLFTFAT